MSDNWRFQETGRDDRKAVQGRPRATDRIDDLFLMINALRRRTVISTQLRGLIGQVRNVNILSCTTLRLLIKVDLSSLLQSFYFETLIFAGSYPLDCE